MKIKIIDVPPGQAPLEVRKAWVGLVFESRGRTSGFTMGIHGGQGENAGGYIVNGAHAVAVLAEKDDHAAMWWKLNASHILEMDLIFAAEVCEEVVS